MDSADSTMPEDSWDSVDFLYGFILLQFTFLFKSMLLVPAVDLNILQVIFGVDPIAYVCTVSLLRLSTTSIFDQ